MKRSSFRKVAKPSINFYEQPNRQRNSSNAKIQKDPLVWDPPSPKEQRATIKKVSIKKSIVPNRSTVEPPNPQRNGYDKPWQANIKKGSKKTMYLIM
jgi:hypothetical protein